MGAARDWYGHFILYLLRQTRRPSRIGGLCAGILLRVLPSPRGEMTVRLWGRPVTMEAEHHLPYIVGTNPLWGMPLVQCLSTLDGTVEFLDVGANIGDSVVMIEAFDPGRCRYTCFEPNAAWRRFCERNTRGLPVTLLDTFVGEGQAVCLEAGSPGTAGSRAAATKTGQRSVPLDELARGKRVDFIKIDTDGFDFSILRSGAGLLREQRPSLFFEWDPALWTASGEDPMGVFHFLKQCGYDEFCFFSDAGMLHCRMSGVSEPLLRSLITSALSRREIDNLHWDVFAADASRCEAAAVANARAVSAARERIHHWHRLQPAFWQS